MARHWLSPGEFNEVVQIGAVSLDGDRFRCRANSIFLVRPADQSRFSRPISRISPALRPPQVAPQGADFAEAYARFAGVCRPRSHPRLRPMTNGSWKTICGFTA